MTFWYNIGAICILSAICLPFLIKSKAADPEDKEKKPFKPMKPVKDIELDEYEEAIGGKLKISDNQRN